MKDVNTLFRKRIGFPLNEPITFENLHIVLEKTAWALPFENMCIIEGRTNEITEKNVTNKVLTNKEGGLCYELNAVLYLFLLENGFHTSLIRGVVYNQQNQRWSQTGLTHVANLIDNNGHLFLVDTGFGGNLPLKPVPLNGETVVSSNGEFRVVREESEHGDFIFYMKVKHRDEEWKKGYAFDSKTKFNDIKVLNEVKDIIVNHPESSFNKKPLITKLTTHGNITLTETSFSERVDGKVNKEEIDKKQFEELRKKYFGL